MLKPVMTLALMLSITAIHAEQDEIRGTQDVHRAHELMDKMDGVLGMGVNPAHVLRDEITKEDARYLPPIFLEILKNKGKSFTERKLALEFLRLEDMKVNSDDVNSTLMDIIENKTEKKDDRIKFAEEMGRAESGQLRQQIVRRAKVVLDELPKDHLLLRAVLPIVSRNSDKDENNDLFRKILNSPQEDPSLRYTAMSCLTSNLSLEEQTEIYVAALNSSKMPRLVQNQASHRLVFFPAYAIRNTPGGTEALIKVLNGHPVCNDEHCVKDEDALAKLQEINTPEARMAIRDHMRKLKAAAKPKKMDFDGKK